MMPPRRSRFGLLLLSVATLIGGAALARWYVAQQAHAVKFADGTEVVFRGGSNVEAAKEFPQPRELTVDGDVFLRAPAGARPLTVRSRLLRLTVTGETALRMTAYSRQAGEQVEVLRGQVIAHKAYASAYAQPDTLGPGQMVMINRSIDLMEKETCKPDELKRLMSWRDDLLRRAGATADR